MAEEQKLNWLIQFAADLAIKPENNWFKEKLIATLKGTGEPEGKPSNALSHIEKTVSKIEKYLKVDSISLIDYSFIEEEKVRNQLLMDCVQMGRYRLGLINNEQNFEEFCRYAHLQCEEMINYFFHKNLKKPGNFYLAVKQVFDEKFTENLKPFSSFGAYSYYYKLNLLLKIEVINSSLFFALKNLQDIRNYISHRNSIEQKKEDDKLFDLGKQNGWAGKTLLKKELEKLPTNEKRQHDSFRLLEFRLRKDWDGVYESVASLLAGILDKKDIIIPLAELTITEDDKLKMSAAKLMSKYSKV